MYKRQAQGKITDIVDETITYAMEKTERSMDRLTNEKMMAVNEYSDTVLSEINKNHQEVVFLYDMLNDKHENLKNTVTEVEKTAKEVRQTVKDAEINAKELTVKEAALKPVSAEMQTACLLYTSEKEEIRAVENNDKYLVPGLPLKRSVIVDISGGGIRFVGDYCYEPDSLVCCKYNLATDGKSKAYTPVSYTHLQCKESGEKRERINEALYEKDHKHGMPADDGRHIVYYSAVFRTGIFHIDRAYRGNHGKHHKAGSRNS